MAIEVFMPKAGMAMEEGRVIRWLKEVGDRVEMGEAIMEIETDKVTMEAESPGSGILLEKLVPDDTTVPVLRTVGWLGEVGEKIPEPPLKPPDEPKAQTPPPVSEVLMNIPGGGVGGKTAATPNARRLSKEMGLPLDGVKPTGRHGEITGKDVISAAAAIPVMAKAPTPEGRIIPITGMRKVIGERMSASHTEIPPVTQDIKIYVDELLMYREKLNVNGRFKITVNDFVLMAVAKAAAESEAVRTMIYDGLFIVRENVNVGFAVGTDSGLLVPVIKGADKLSLSEISDAAKVLAEKASNGRLRPDEYGDGVITVSNMGMYGIVSFTPIINQPEASIVGVCAIQEEAVFKNGAAVPAKHMVLSYTYDHRIMDGITSAKFQKRVKDLLENPLIMCAM